MNQFTTIKGKDICNLISNARQNIIYIAPGISFDVAKSIINKKDLCVEIIIDSNPEVCRLGYGDIEAVELLMNNDITVRRCAGVRISLIVCDKKAFVFCAPPLIVEEEPDTYAPNAIIIDYEQAKELVKCIIPNSIIFDEENASKQLTIFDESSVRISSLVPTSIIKPEELKHIKEDLRICPPQKFDLARRVRVYQSYVQFIDLSLTGCHFERHTISIPPKLMKLTKDQETERLKSTFKLLGEKSKISSKSIEKKVNDLRKKYIKSLGSRYGTVILTQKKSDFIKEAENLEAELIKFKADIEQKLSKEFDYCRKELVKLLAPIIKRNPPEDLMAGIPTNKPTSDQVKIYLEDELNRIIPNVGNYVQDMKLQYDFKDVTYEMLESNEFFAALKDAYKYIEWPKPFNEFQAAKEVSD